MAQLCYTVSTLPANGTLALGGVAVTAGQVITPAQSTNLIQTEPSQEQRLSPLPLQTIQEQ
jgi:hypothetical protein